MARNGVENRGDGRGEGGGWGSTAGRRHRDAVPRCGTDCYGRRGGEAPGSDTEAAAVGHR